MPTIKLNPEMWQITEVKLGDAVLRHGDLLEVSDAEWNDELRHVRTRTSGNVYRTYVTTDEEVLPEVEHLWLRPQDLGNLSHEKLKELAADRGLAKSGTKAELAAKIVAYEEELAAASDESP